MLVDFHNFQKVKNAKHFHKINQGNIQFPMTLKGISAFEQKNMLKINVFELSSKDRTLSPKHNNKNYYEEQIDLLLYENQYCLNTNLNNFRTNNEDYKHFFRTRLNTYGNQTKFEEHMLRCIEPGVCNLSYMLPKQKIKFIDWYMKFVTPLSITAAFERMNVLLECVNENDSMEKFFVNKPVGIVYNILKNPENDNLDFKKTDGFGCGPTGSRSFCDYNKYSNMFVKIDLNGLYIRCWKQRLE